MILLSRRNVLHLMAAALLPFEAFALEGTPRALFDGKSLAGWSMTDFGGGGEPVVEDGSILLPAGNDLTGVTFQGEIPKTDYQFELEAKRIEGGDFFCGVTFPVGDSHCTLILGGWGGAVVGISSIDDLDASENATTLAMNFEKNRWYKIRVRNSQQKIEVWLDGKPCIEVDLRGKKLSMRRGEIELSKPFGIASFRTRAAIRGIQIQGI